MRALRRRILVSLFVAALGTAAATGPVRADPCGDEHACAAASFKEGRKRVEAGDWAGAVPLFQKSIELESTIGARLNLGDCYVKTAAPWNAYVQYQAAARQADEANDARHAPAEASAAALEPQVLRVRLVSPDARPAVVRVDGVVVSSAELALLHDGRYAVDPSRRHSVLVSPETGSPWTGTISGAPGLTEVARVTFEAIPEPVVAPSPPPVPPPTSSAVSPLSPPPAPSPGSGQRTFGLVLGAAGGVGVATGLLTGLIALGDASHVRSLCGSYPTQCLGPPGGPTTSANDAARAASLVSTVAFVAGGAALATGVVLYMTAPRGTLTVAPAIGRDGGGVALSALW